MPFHRLLGIRPVAEHDDGVTVELTVREDLLNIDGVLHGGVAAALADVAVGRALIRNYGRGRRVATVELKINYLRAVRKGKVTARGRLIKSGKTLAVGRAELFDDAGEQVAEALVTYMVFA